MTATFYCFPLTEVENIQKHEKKEKKYFSEVLKEKAMGPTGSWCHYHVNKLHNLYYFTIKLQM